MRYTGGPQNLEMTGPNPLGWGVTDRLETRPTSRVTVANLFAIDQIIRTR